MANTKVTQHVIADNAITTDMITDANITHAKLHGTMDLSGKTVTLPAVAIPSASTATTQSALDNSTKVATTSYVDSAVTALIDSAPSGLNTLNELAAALNDDTSFSSTVTTSLAAKAPLASPSFTGTVQLLDTNFPDNRAARFGDSQDLQIYHDGTHSYVASSTGSLYIRTGNTLQIENQSGSEDLATFAVNGAATLFYDNDAKLATAAYGIDAQGTGALKVPVGTTAQRPTAATGQLRFNTTDGRLEVYNSSEWSAVGATGTGNHTLDTFTGDNSTTAFTLSLSPANEDALSVFIDGAYQEKGDYSLSGNTLTLDTAPLSGEKISVHTIHGAVHDGTAALNQQFTGDGSTTAFTLTSAPGSENNTQIYINGVYQQKTDYTVSGTTLTFDTAPSNGDIIEVNSFTVTNLGNSDQVTEGSSNLYHTTARAISALTDATLAGNLTLEDASSPTLKLKDTTQNSDLRLFAQDSNVGIGTFSNHDMKFYTNSAITLSLKSSGNVGVGTDSPAQKFHVSAGSTNANTIARLEQGTTAGNYSAIEVGRTDGSGNVHVTPAVTGGIPIGGIPGILLGSENTSIPAVAIQTPNSSNGHIVFNPKGSEKVRITADGDVGIGTDSPSGKLMVREDTAGSPARLIISNGGNAQSGTTSRLSFYEATSEKSYIERRRDNSGITAFVTPADDNPFVWENASGEFMRFTGSKVGIGETSPLGKLHVKVSDTSASASAQGNLLVLEDTENGLSILSSTSGAGYINFGDSDDNDIGMVIYDHSANAMRFWTNAAERMRIASDGKVGIGTTSPQDTLHVLTDSSTTNDTVDVMRIEATSSGTPAVGFGATIDFRGERAAASSDTMGRIGFVADTMTSSRIDGAFVVETAVDGSPSEKMRIESSGDVRFTNHIAASANEGAQFVPDSVGRDVLNTGSTSTSSVGLLHFFDPNGFVAAITTSGGQAQYGTGSDYRLKENLNYSWDASTELKKIKPVKFNYINHEDKTIEGFIAHELQEVVPNAVVYDKDATLSDGSPRYQMVDHSKLVPLLTKAIQEQQVIIDDLKARIKTLEG